MSPYREHRPIDTLEIEAMARKARAEAFAQGVAAVRRWISARFSGQPQSI